MRTTDTCYTHSTLLLFLRACDRSLQIFTGEVHCTILTHSQKPQLAPQQEVQLQKQTEIFAQNLRHSEKSTLSDKDFFSLREK